MPRNPSFSTGDILAVKKIGTFFVNRLITNFLLNPKIILQK